MNLLNSENAFINAKNQIMEGKIKHLENVQSKASNFSFKLYESNESINTLKHELIEAIKGKYLNLVINFPADTSRLKTRLHQEIDHLLEKWQYGKLNLKKVSSNPLMLET